MICNWSTNIFVKLNLSGRILLFNQWYRCLQTTLVSWRKFRISPTVDLQLKRIIHTAISGSWMSNVNFILYIPFYLLILLYSEQGLFYVFIYICRVCTGILANFWSRLSRTNRRRLQGVVSLPCGSCYQLNTNYSFISPRHSMNDNTVDYIIVARS